MKAKNINGNIQVYSQQQFERQFNNYILSDGSNAILFYLSDKEVLENEGFFDVITPEIQEGEKLGGIYFDEVNQVFTYPIIQKTVEEIEAEYQATIPQTVSQRQLRTQLLLNGFNLADIQTAINALQDPQKSIAQVAWDYAVVFDRKDPLLVAIATSLNLSESDLKQIYINASQL